MVEGLQVDFDSALLIESRYFCRTAINPVARNLMRLSQLRADAASPGALDFAAALEAALADEIKALREEGVPEALLRNATRAAGLPPSAIGAGMTARKPAARRETEGATAPALDDIRDRLLYAMVIAALRGVARGTPASRDEADLVSVRACGFPAHTGGALRFIRHSGKDTFAGRAAALGPRFALPPGWDA
jgi:hypothetical protein